MKPKLPFKPSLLVAALALTLLALPAGVRGQVFTTLRNFTGEGSIEAYPVQPGLVRGSDGKFYGTTEHGGGGNLGTVFSITPAGAYTTLHSFVGNGTEGVYPAAALIQGSDGNFYGTTFYGGANVQTGTIFSITSAGVLNTLYSFTALDSNGHNFEGANPVAALVQDTDGTFYGTAYSGGGGGTGSVFSITPDGDFSLFYSFPATDNDEANSSGANPNAELARGSDGNFYGTTLYGGDSGLGTIFSITPDGPTTSVHRITVDDEPRTLLAALIQGGDGNFYGTSANGGDHGTGTIFTMTPEGSLTTVYSFSAAQAGTNENADGAYPAAALIQASDGTFYGTTKLGGASGAGTVFAFTPAGGLTTLHSFGAVDSKGVNSDGANPIAALVQDSGGLLLGTTAHGGSEGNGTIFKLGFTPVITSSTTAAASTGRVFSYQITATGSPTSYTAPGLPTGLTLNATTGLITGTPKNVGTAAVTIGATNATGTGSAKLTITIAAPPAITSATSATAVQDKAFSYQITASNHPTSYAASGLPTGLGINTATGLISGSPKNVGKAAVTLSATNAGGTGTARLTITITAIPIITSATTASATVGQAFSYQITATNTPTSYAASGLPTGLTINTTTGLIAGTPRNTGKAAVTISATNAAGTGTAKVTVTIAAP